MYDDGDTVGNAIEKIRAMVKSRLDWEIVTADGLYAEFHYLQDPDGERPPLWIIYSGMVTTVAASIGTGFADDRGNIYILGHREEDNESAEFCNGEIWAISVNACDIKILRSVER